MTAVQSGEAGSFARLLDEVTPYLRAVARRRLGGARPAERAVQEALLVIHRQRHAYDPGAPIAPWLAGIVEAEALRLKGNVNLARV